MTLSPKPYLSKLPLSTVLSLINFYFKTDHRGIHLPSITIVLMVHQSLRDLLGNNLRKNKNFQNIKVLSIIWTSMNVDVTSLSDSRMRKVNYLYSSIKFQTIK